VKLPALIPVGFHRHSFFRQNVGIWIFFTGVFGLEKDYVARLLRVG
jgi:hypothetical protein